MPKKRWDTQCDPQAAGTLRTGYWHDPGAGGKWKWVLRRGKSSVYPLVHEPHSPQAWFRSVSSRPHNAGAGSLSCAVGGSAKQDHDTAHLCRWRLLLGGTAWTFVICRNWNHPSGTLLWLWWALLLQSPVCCFSKEKSGCSVRKIRVVFGFRATSLPPIWAWAETIVLT